MKIHTKILLFILSITIVIFVLAIGYISIKARKAAYYDATRLTDAYSREFANLTTSKINLDMGVAKAMAQTFKGYKELPPEERDIFYRDVLKNILIENKQFLAVWIHWELEAVDERFHRKPGRVRKIFYRQGKNFIFRPDTVDTQGYNKEGGYYKIRENKKDVITDPYTYSYSQEKLDEVLEVSLCVPVLTEGNYFVGLAGIDVNLENFQKVTDNIKPFNKSYAFFVANNGKLVTYPDKRIINKSISKIFPADNAKHNILSKIKHGEHFNFVTKQKNKEYYVSLSPIQIGETDTPWALGVVVPIDEIMLSANNDFYISLLSGGIGLLVLSIIIIIISKAITRPLVEATFVLKTITKGDIASTTEMSVKTSDEVGQIRNSINALLQNLKNTANFATKIGEGQLNSNLKVLSKKDVLGNALLEMKKRLLQAKDEDEKRKQEDEKRNWATRGIAKFAEILRQNNDNLEEFSYNIISNLVKYLNINQGGFFIINDDNSNDTFIEMTAAYAYNRRKMVEKRVEVGISLIGRCVQEQETIYMTDIPQNYINITSGLGEENPKSLLIVPLKFNDEIYGIIELASFSNFEEHQIDFVEKIGESIASTISSVKINMKTSQLLNESKKKSEDLMLHEEEMRQSLEELQAIQEESDRREREMLIQVNVINSILATVEFDLYGQIISANTEFLNLTGYTMNDLRGKNHKILCEKEHIESPKYMKFWDDLRAGKQQVGDFIHICKSGKRICLNAGYSLALDEYGDPRKIVQYANDITRLTNTFNLKDKKIEAINKTTIEIEIDTNGKIKQVNDLFCEYTNYSPKDLIDKNLEVILSKDTKDKIDFKEILKTLTKGKEEERILEIIKKDNTKLNLKTFFIPIINLDKDVYQIYIIAIKE